MQNASAKGPLLALHANCVQCSHFRAATACFLCVKLYCKCNSLTPRVKQLIPVSHRQNLSLHLSHLSPSSLLITGSFQRKTPLFNYLYSCVIVLATGTFGSEIWLLIQQAHLKHHQQKCNETSMTV